MKEKKDYTQFTCKMNRDMLEQLKRNVLDYDLKSSLSSYDKNKKILIFSTV